MAVKISSLELENVKRVKAVSLKPTDSGLTIIGGNNRNGKTSVLDAIAWALGGEKMKPSKAQNESSVLPPSIHLELSNGLIVERKGKNSSLKVTDPEGKSGGQKLLDRFISSFALDLPKFMNMDGKKKAEKLLEVIGVGDELNKLDRQYADIYEERRYVGRDCDQKKKFAEGLPVWNIDQEEEIDVAVLAETLRGIIESNNAIQRRRDNLVRTMAQVHDIDEQIAELQQKKESAQKWIDEETTEVNKLKYEDPEDLQNKIDSASDINSKIADNRRRKSAEAEAKKLDEEYAKHSADLESIKQKRMDLLNGADLPLPGLTVEDNELCYNGQKWDNMSGSEQLIVATAIVRKLNPECGFVLMDKLEQMDLQTLEAFGKWLEGEGLQAIATRVSTGDECSIFIEDGYSVESLKQEKIEYKKPEIIDAPKWKAGEF